MAIDLRDRTVLLLALWINSCVFGYNIDTNIPVIKKGISGSYFGFSVAEHINDDYLILVGAPLFNSTSEGTTVQTGGVFKCNARSMDPDDCQYIEDIETSISNDGQRAGQWMGSTISSTTQPGKRVLVCAHRYTTNYVGIGTCVTLNSDLSADNERRPCRDDGLENEGLAYCQAGTSGVMMNDERVLLGAPGAVDWTGGLWTQYTGDNIREDLSWFRSPIYLKEDTRKPRPIDLTSYMGFSVTYGRFDPNGVTFVGGAPRSVSKGQVVLFVKDNKGLTYRDNQILTGEEPFSAFGYSLTAIDVNDDSFDDLIVGSPMYLEKDQSIGGAIYIYMGSDSEMITKDSVPIKITSRKMSESDCLKFMCKDARFGHTLAKAGDVNLDGYQDLVVGAPYEGVDKGAIYIFHGSADGLKETYAQRIYASDIVTSPPLRAFGHAISGGMDMDGNGYDDIAVGSYESGQAILLRTRPIVHLTSAISVQPNKFNISETALCFNGVKKRCVVMTFILSYTIEPVRSVPLQVIYTIEADTGKQRKRVEFDNPTPGMNGQIEKTVTLPIVNRNVEVKHIIYLKDNFQDKLHPVQFKATYRLPDENWPTRRKRQASFPDINNFPVLVMTGGTDATDITLNTQIAFAKECGSNDICESSLSLMAEVKLADVDQQTGYKVMTDIGSDLTIKFTVTNKMEPAYETMFYIVVPKEFEYKNSKALNSDSFLPECSVYNATLMTCGGLGNPLFKTVVREFTITFNTAGLDPKTNFFSIKAFVNTTSSEQTPNEDVKNLMVKVVSKTNMVVYGSAKPDADVVFSGEVRGESAISRAAQIGPSINHTYVVLNDGNSTVGQAELQIDWPYEMKPLLPGHSGKHLLYLIDIQTEYGDIDCSRMDPSIFNPLNVDLNPEVQLTGTDLESSGDTDLESENVTQTNVTNEDGYTTVGQRRRRQAETNVDEEEKEGKNDDSRVRLAEQREKMEKVVVLSCEQENVQCSRLTCMIYRLGPSDSASVKVVARLWESTLLEDYPAVDMVKIQSKGQVKT
ncbi:integrin alpha-PS1-like isoform X1 [Pecten maximus]|uniref:integrin alpha-PS1-like isoform X1 n=2 Tax=Pecten maximus TaxID=6579 RepID=UPI001459157F|nr:integrin alpha-PS1-like isoform X1 [Pecten maximus]XP_033761990.1 integrin alpha-PS1-like isoform X1 [Pecten maximus]XP_033761991.1 integrin alpha-PS1-like isoform X1 [Pecten maximus]XP_033761992.1 integrin alpha-PS1-like isoform X1 [Pecten maximus]XP_033761993.1 integrin alpha-PS1-like isoform X1 [Pecten maximus]XP_033761994.1 integrin alpha-PS1-like isoform X1 [Pecten maximus]XP_033761995.1 integrin alpha-PS1-like isoform X1 [Pecten maximus]